MTWIQVVDDAVKIGLGALIAGLFAWLVALHHSRSSLHKLRFERRSRILSEVAETYEACFRSYLKYTKQLYGLDNAIKNPPKHNQEESIYSALLADRWHHATELRVKMNNELDGAFKAQSQLLLLGAELCCEKADALHMAILAADASYKFEGRSFTLAEDRLTTQAVLGARRALYRELTRELETM